VKAPEVGENRSGHGHEGHDHSKHEIKDASVDELLKPGLLPDVAIGSADAKVTIVEYASMSCGHCGRVHRDVMPAIKKKYIDTGKVRLIIREFPLNYTAMAVAMLARCAGPDNTYGVIDAMFNHQKQWLKRGDMTADIQAIVTEFGVSDEVFKTCIKRKDLFHQIKAVRQRAMDKFGVKSTPTFFINGKALVGPTKLEEFDAVIEPMLK